MDSDACVKEMTAVPAEPENPEINSAIEKWSTVSVYSEEQVEWLANLGDHHTGQCTRTGGCLRRVKLLIKN